ncbi:MAG TPA: TonB-dependent receptor [Vicinamibacterales bacterium]|nr:TonB-dependent receptor [Vicinamibacterales bacterium]
MFSRLSVCAALSLALVIPRPLIAQQTVDVGSVSGRIADASGSSVPGASVTATHRATNVVAAATTDQEGRFRFPYLRIGTYDLVVTIPGFRDATRTLTVLAGSAFDVPISLALAGVESSVHVTAEAPVIETARSQIAATVAEAEVAALPMNGRNFLELALLVPGVSPTNIASTQLFPETSAVPGVTISVGSQRNLSNNFVVDGLSANDDAAGLSGITYGVDAIEQFQVITSGAQAELGRALGGYINVVTKSGTNALRGTIYDFLRDDALNGRNALSETKLPMNQSQYGASIGGPLRKDRAFYFVNAEHRALDQTGLTTIPQASVDAINARLAVTEYRGPAISTGSYPNPVDTHNVLAKIDHQFSGRDQFSIRYSRYGVKATNARGAGGLSAATASSNLDNTDQAVALSNSLILSSRTVLETRAQVAHGDLKATPSDLAGPTVSIAGVATFGTSSSSPTGRLNKMYQLVNNLSHQRGAHALRAGVDVIYNDDLITFPRSIRGSYSFSSLANFLSGTYNNAGFGQTFGITELAQTNPNLGMYVQDEWKVTNAVTLNAGLRYDLQWLETIALDTSNISPRLGVAWSPFDSRRTIVRASAGIFYDRVPLRALANALMSAGNTTDVSALRQYSVSLSPTQAGAPVFPAILPAAIPLVTLPNLTTMERDLQNAYSRQVSAEVEHQLGEQTTVGAGYQYLQGRNLLMSINQNVPTCVAAGSNNGCRPIPAYANNSQYSSAGESNYHGLHVSLAQRMDGWGQYRVSYTLSKSMNNVGEAFFSSPIDPTDLSKDWGRSDNDQRHRLAVNGSARVAGFQVGAMLQAYSAPPFNITSGVTTVQGTAGRPVVNGAFIDRNTGEGTRFFNLNARISRTFRLGARWQLELLAECFNLTDRANVVTRNANFGSGAYPANPSATFNQITAVGEPRSFQFGARLRF